MTVPQRLAGLVLAVLGAGHVLSGLGALGTAVDAFRGGGFTGVLAGLVLLFMAVLLSIGGSWGLRLGWRLAFGDGGAIRHATHLLIGFAILAVFSPVGAGPLALSHASSGWLRLGLVAAPLAAIALVAPRPGRAGQAE